MRRATSHPTAEEGLALIVTLLAVALTMALGMALVLVTMTEARIAFVYRQGAAALYAAEGAIERVLPDILRAPDLDAIVDGTVVSTFTDGSGDGVRAVPGGGTVDLTEATHIVRVDSPWWRLFANGAVGDAYAAVWVARASGPDGGLAMRAHAYGPGGVQRAIEVTVTRSDPGVMPPSLRVVSWHELK